MELEQGVLGLVWMQSLLERYYFMLTPVYSLNFYLKREAQYDVNAEKKVQVWVEAVTGEAFVGNFVTHLKVR